ncbi:MAG: signal peptidase I [Proteobacteria bacterium]|nr:signal peptidase I [Pseudomonadota bacterium]MDA1058935.1 signal peptidase I [Pseudomonadota bacterium]
MANARATRKGKGGVGETVRTLVYAVLIAVVIRTVAFEPFNIPSGSMEPTLLVGDYLFVSKFSYGYSRYSLPFGPDLFSGRLFRQTPERGDVAVFKLPSDPSTDFIKRVIGLPGDRIQMIESVLHINGAPVERELIDDFIVTHRNGVALRVPQRVPQYIETLPNGRRYRTLDQGPNEPLDNTAVFQIRQGFYFMMGDNRDNSQDSRVTFAVGQVPEQNLVGRAEVMFFSTNGTGHFWEFWKWPTAIRWRRLFKTVQEF